jgi:hypothetical protein
VNPAVWFIVGAVLIVGLVIMYGPTIAELWARTRAVSRCESIRADLDQELAREGGGSSERARQLQAELTACTNEAARYGASSSLAEVTLIQCDADYEALEAEFSAYKSTDYSDIIKRGNKLGNMLALGERMAGCLAQALAEAEREAPSLGPEGTILVMAKVRGAAVRALAASEARLACYRSAAPGCDRYWGSLEADNGTKAAAELARINEPLRRVVDAAIAAIAAVRNQQGAAAAEAAAAEAARLREVYTRSLAGSGVLFGPVTLTPAVN